MSQPYTSETEFQPSLHEALEIVRPEMQALTKKELLLVNLEPTTAVSTMRAALPALLGSRQEIAESCPRFNMAHLENLELYARALLQAHAICNGIEVRSKALARLSKEANDHRVRLLSDVNALVGHGCIPAGRLKGLKGPNGHRNIASDVLTLVELLRNSWPELIGRTCITEAALNRAASIADAVIGANGTRKKATERSVEAALQRQQAFTLFVCAYDEVRRAISYLRWHDGDVERIAPSLYRKHKAPHKKAANDNTAAAVTATSTDTGSALTAGGAAPLVDATDSAEAVAKPRVGLPGIDPFMH